MPGKAISTATVATSAPKKGVAPRNTSCTEIGIFDSAGLLRYRNDDANGTLQSQVVATLPADTYTLVVSGYQTNYDHGPALDIGCSAYGTAEISVGSFSTCRSPCERWCWISRSCSS